MIRKLLLATSVMSSFVIMPAAAAQDGEATAEQGGIAEIVVTAQRRDENVQDVPIAISAFSAEQMAAQGITNTLQIGQYVPNLIAQNNTGIGSANAYFLRGLGSTETIATFDPPVGTYVDDIYLSRQNANNLSLFDVERVEVLRGPQGTLFGRNTTGGAISVIMAKPGNTISGFGEIGYGRFGKTIARGSTDLPLSDSFAIKLSGYWQNDRGYAKNVTTGERLNDDDGWGVRLGVRGELAPWARWNAGYMHIVSKGDNILNFECNPANPADCKGRFISTGLSENGGPPSPYAPVVVTGRKANYGLGQEAVSDIITSNLQFDIGENTTLSLITGYVSLTQQFAYDFFDGRGGPSISAPFPAVRGYARGGFTIVNDGKHSQFTQEIKLNGTLGNGLIDYVGGLYYIDERNKTDLADLFTLSPTTTLLLGDRILRNTTSAYAGYLQADLNLSEQFKLTAGFRYTDEKKVLRFNDNRASCNDSTLELTCIDNANLFVPANGTTVLTAKPIPTQQRVKVWTPRFAANFKPNDDLLFFASATRGFKSGGWNARATTPSQAVPFGPEKVWSYEAGIKSDLFDRRVRANLTVFQLDVSDLQILAGLLNPTTGALTFITRNFADYRNRGVEAEIQFVPVDGLNFYTNFGYQNDKYLLPGNAPATDVYGIQSVAAQLASCRGALAAGKIPGGPNTPATQPSITACAAGIVTAEGTIATPVRTPKWSISMGASYEAQMGAGFTLVPSVNGSFHSRQEVAIANLSIYNAPVSGVNQPVTGPFPANPFRNGAFVAGSQSEPVWLFNAGLALNAPDKAWTLSVDCTNCLNESYVQTALSNYSYLNRPMEWTVRAKYRF
ncbi:TonB-dependent receptor [Sphingorhabdus sp.]|jgi:iron complex outermembrane receptor protein|uniref:TonB-dependent receptor n=1 Tax=Sphingorhabdus sp. TaxID=1902408 RepID=UPI003D81C1CB